MLSLKVLYNYNNMNKKRLMTNKRLALSIVYTMVAGMLVSIFDGGAIISSTANGLYAILSLIFFILTIWAVVRLVRSDE